MPEKKERFGQGILSMALANFDSWVHSPRTVLMLLFIIAICYLQMCGYKMTLNETGYTMHMGETLFYEFNFGCNMPMTTALFLIMVSELPRKIAYQQYSLIRSSRWKWMVAQILYCFMMVAAMVALILICIAIQALQVVTPGTGWSDIIRIAEKAIEPEEALVAQYILNQFTPFTALLLAILPMFCFWFTMVLVILMFGVWGASVVGVMVYAFIMVAHVIIYFEYFPFPMSMPMHFSTLRDIVSGLEDGMQLQEVARVMGGYAALIAGIIAVMLVNVKKVDMSFSNEK